MVNTPGRYVVIGDLVLPPYVGTAGATHTTLTLTVGKDTVAPTTTLSWSPAAADGHADWYVTAPAFALSSTDAFGVAGTQYRINDGDWTFYPGTAIAAHEQGTVQVQFRSTDTSGNVEDWKAVTIKIDTAKPTATFSSTISDAAFGQVAPAPTCTATDATSGPLDCVISGYSTAVGTHTLTATATDVAGNVSPATQTYTVRP
jgi:hypothetical protein